MAIRYKDSNGNWITGQKAIETQLIDAQGNFVATNVEDALQEIKKINLKPDVIVIDPPRAGLDKKNIDNILQFNASRIVYVSCDPITLARDLNILGKDYNILELTPVDMFPNTCHVECVSVLHRKKLEK